MKVLVNILKGFRTVKAAGRLVVVLYLVNLAFSLVLAVPLHRALTESLGRSQAGERMARGFDYLWWEEFRDKGDGLSRTFDPSVIGRGALLNNLEGLVTMRFVRLPAELLLAFLLYIILHTFLAGGTLGLYRREAQSFDPRRFLEGAVSSFPTFLGLMALSWVFFFSIGVFLRGWLQEFIHRISRDALTEKSGFFGGLAVSLVIWALLMFVQMVFDYARIKSVLADRRNAGKAFLDGLGFVFRHPAATLGLYYLLFAGGIALSIIYVLVKETIGQSSAGGVILAFALQQAFILGLIGLRCWTYAGQLHLARHFEG